MCKFSFQCFGGFELPRYIYDLHACIKEFLLHYKLLHEFTSHVLALQKFLSYLTLYFFLSQTFSCRKANSSTNHASSLQLSPRSTPHPHSVNLAYFDGDCNSRGKCERPCSHAIVSAREHPCYPNVDMFTRLISYHLTKYLFQMLIFLTN